jgi:(4-(4-[2-(gamma-L-glutamylamino)ethyl]phenoxymethyl)furan-2-yl)methanamine synthase
VTWLALDIGGANIKVADGLGYCSIQPFALWRRPERLAESLQNVIEAAPPCNRIAATMTGELADCFETKEQGVRHILQALSTAAGGRHIHAYQTSGRLQPLDTALDEPLLAAAANWHALARFAGRFAANGAALLIDIGSTTTDVIPLFNGRPQTAGCTDTERLLSGELVYTGVQRSPVCSVLGYLPYRGQLCPVAQELFATTWDAYLTLSELPEEPDNRNTADGRPATREAARARLARMICADETSFDDTDAMVAAETIRRDQMARIAVAVAQVVARQGQSPATVIVSGAGEFLARRIVEQMNLAGRLVSLGDQLGPALSRCAPAHALAVLAREGIET